MALDSRPPALLLTHTAVCCAAITSAKCRCKQSMRCCPTCDIDPHHPTACCWCSERVSVAVRGQVRPMRVNETAAAAVARGCTGWGKAWRLALVAASSVQAPLARVLLLARINPLAARNTGGGRPADELTASTSSARQPALASTAAAVRQHGRRVASSSQPLATCNTQKQATHQPHASMHPCQPSTPAGTACTTVTCRRRWVR